MWLLGQHRITLDLQVTRGIWWTMIPILAMSSRSATALKASTKLMVFLSLYYPFFYSFFPSPSFFFFLFFFLFLFLFALFFLFFFLFLMIISYLVTRTSLGCVWLHHRLQIFQIDTFLRHGPENQWLVHCQSSFWYIHSFILSYSC